MAWEVLTVRKTQTTRATCAWFVTLICLAFVASAADAQIRRRPEVTPKQIEKPAPAPSFDKRDSMVTAPGAFGGRPYWLGLAQCGGIYFKLNTLYTDIAVHARAVKPDPTLNNEYTKKLNDAIKTATLYFTGAERLLMADRGLERVDAVLIYDEQSRAAGNRVKTIDAALSAAKTCPALYQACHETYSKACGEIPTS
ncbi:MAG TPA: hypothetical protein VH206_13660 [Xanthobacteraceae bacterium]|jgi:hypothetical protein|nr:hypothetical protein [Xanthobacteraceae bacterium]